MRTADHKVCCVAVAAGDRNLLYSCNGYAYTMIPALVCEQFYLPFVFCVDKGMWRRWRSLT